MPTYLKSGSFYAGLSLTSLAVFIGTRLWADDPQPPAPADIVAEVTSDEPVSPDLVETEIALINDLDVPADTTLLFAPDGRVGTWRMELDELSKLEQKSRQLAQRAKVANKKKDEALYKQLKEELTKLVQSQFKLIEARRAQQVTDMEARLATLRDVLKQRTDHADKIIERRVKGLLGESDALDWNPSSSPTEMEFLRLGSSPDSAGLLPSLARLEDHKTGRMPERQALPEQRIAGQDYREFQALLDADRQRAKSDLAAARDQIAALTRNLDELRKQYEANRDQFETARRQAEEYKKALDNEAAKR